MERRIKLIWDFRGPGAGKTATHFHDHLLQSPLYVPGLETGVSHLNEAHSIAFMVVGQTEMPRYRDALKPHRGEYAEPPKPNP